jgi:hypothetical protein
MWIFSKVRSTWLTIFSKALASRSGSARNYGMFLTGDQFLIVALPYFGGASGKSLTRKWQPLQKTARSAPGDSCILTLRTLHVTADEVRIRLDFSDYSQTFGASSGCFKMRTQAIDDDVLVSLVHLFLHFFRAK